MKKNILLGMMVASVATLGFISCSKSDNGGGATNIETASSQALTDFVNVLAEPAYADFVAKATALNNAVNTLVTSPTTANQTAAQQAWVATRVVWEQSEGFLLGPVEDNNYDPNMDTWPTDKNSIDSMLSKNPDITNASLNNVDDALKGFHPLEYYLWDFDPTTSTYTDAQKKYMVALAANILDQTKALQNSWTVSDGYANELLNPGSAASRYKTKESALEDIALKLIDICNEVGESKMPVPFGTNKADADSTQTESPYSHNSVADFKNNIQGALNSYTCSYGGNNGTSLSSLVQINNRSLDTKIKTAFSAAISSFSGLDGITFEKAIYNNRPAVQNIIDAIESLKTLLDGQLVPYIQQYIKD